MIIGDWMGRGATYWPERTAVVDVAKGPKGRFTYAQMNERASRLASFFVDHANLASGDRVGLLAHNGVEYLDALFAAAKLGAVTVPFSWRLPAAELAPLMRQTRIKALLYSDEFAPVVEELRAMNVELPTLVHLDGAGLRGSIFFDAALEAAPLAKTHDAVNPEDTLCLLFTGGTTGLPKAAKVSYRMVAWNTLNTLIHELLPGDVTITHTPMFHTGGLLVYTLPLLTVGGTVVIMRRWDADRTLELLDEEKVTAFFAVPTQYQQMILSPKFSQVALKSLRFVTSGGAALPIPVLEAWQKVHPIPFKQGFGMTEFGPGIFSMGPEFARTKAGSIGRPNYFVEARLTNDEGQDVAVGETGELWLKGPSMCSGYDAEVGPQAIDANGWFHTGDLAYRDADGFYFIVDRKKDMFISGGENVYPVEIERALYEHAAVHQCAVIGIPDATWGEVGKAFVVLKPDARITSEELLGHVRQRLAKFKVPKQLELVTSLPTSPAGKILKRELKAKESRTKAGES